MFHTVTIEIVVIGEAKDTIDNSRVSYTFVNVVASDRLGGNTTSMGNTSSTIIPVLTFRAIVRQTGVFDDVFLREIDGSHRHTTIAGGVFFAIGINDSD